MTVWEKFIKNQGNEHVAREAFENLCQEILKKHFPGKTIVSVNKLDKTNEFKSLTVVFLPKFFTDALTSSRKGQIRKGFNKTIEQAQAKGIKIFKWILCIPYKLTQTELQWWAQWKYKNFDQYNIDIELFDGDQIYSLAKQYGLSKLWLLDSPEIEEERPEEHTEIEIPDIDEADGLQRIETGESTSTAPEDNNQPGQENKEQEAITGEKTVQEENVQDGETEQATELQETTEQPEEEQTGETNTEQKIPETDETTFKEEDLGEYQKHKYYYKKIADKIAGLSSEEKEQFEQLRQQSEFSHKKFDTTIPENLKKEKVLQLFYQARSYEVEKQYDKALVYYEALNNRKEEVRKYLKNKIADINKALNNISKRLVFENNILYGDYHRVSGNKMLALEFYEKALRIYPESREANLKYYETFGDILMSEGLYDKAKDAYSKAKKHLLKDNDYRLELKQKEQIARYRYYASKMPVFSFVFRILSKAKDKDTRLIPQEDDYIFSRNTSMAITVIILGILMFFLYKADINITFGHKKTLAAYDFEKVALAKGDYYMDKYDKYGLLRIHVVDSARDSYRRAMYYQPLSKEAKEKYEKADKIWKSYIQLAQKRIKQNPQKYFVSLRNAHEGLKLFKYKYDPNNPKLGKYGYVDTNMNIVIPPVYDFDYNRRIKPGKENFNAGRAIVCLASDNGDTLYFKIDRKGHRVSKVISLNALKRKK